jgi:hypothetical protein
LAKKGEDTTNRTWRAAEKQPPRALMTMSRMNFNINKMNLLKRLIGRVMGTFNDKQAKLLPGLYFQQNWHLFIHQEPVTTLQTSLQLYSVFHPL